MGKKRTKKTFVLDTNVILHDASSIHRFEEHDIVIPIAVIEELDHFKRGSQVINLNAREFARTLDEITAESLFNGGYSLGRNKGKVRVEITNGLNDKIKQIFREDNSDHRILSLTYDLSKKTTPSDSVILVTKDVNLRMKAKALGLMAEDYTSDKVRGVEELYSGKELVESFNDDIIARLHKIPFMIPFEDAASEFDAEVEANKYYILRNENRSVLSWLDQDKSILHRVDKVPAFGIMPRNAEQTFAINALLNRDIPLVTITGKAGTGKTLLALAAALEIRKYYRQIYISRPIVPLSNKDIGFLPGDVDSKIGPYMQPLWDNLKIIQDQYTENDKQYQLINNLVKDQKLVVEPLTYIRGRSLQRLYFIVDEAQNLTPHEIKTIITRAGEGVKIVFTGDIYQIDHPYLDSQSNGLSYLIEHFKGQKIYAHINLEKGERSELAELASNIL